MISDVIANQLADTFQLVHSDAEEIAQYLANGEPVLVAEIAVMTLSGNVLIISAPNSPEASPNREPGEGEEENPGERAETDDPGSFKIKDSTVPCDHGHFALPATRRRGGRRQHDSDRVGLDPSRRGAEIVIKISTLTNEAKEARKARLEEKKILTSRISETSRFVSFGLLALYYGLQTADDHFSQNIRLTAGDLIEIMAICALLSLISDYLQYFFGSWSVKHALNSASQLYDQTRMDYKLREFFYSAKQVLTFAGVIALLIAIILNIAH